MTTRHNPPLATSVAIHLRDQHALRFDRETFEGFSTFQITAVDDYGADAYGEEQFAVRFFLPAQAQKPIEQEVMDFAVEVAQELDESSIVALIGRLGRLLETEKAMEAARMVDQEALDNDPEYAKYLDELEAKAEVILRQEKGLKS